jgi:uncharacterized protein YeaO (DUF488 family)
VGESACFANLLDDEGRMPARRPVAIRRVYDPRPPDEAEVRVLVDRVWPRGVSREAIALARWAREVAPSTQLRRWFGHDPARWPEFRRRYREELTHRTPELKELARLTREAPLVLLYAAKDREHNQALVLKEVLEEALEEAL